MGKTLIIIAFVAMVFVAVTANAQELNLSSGIYSSFHTNFGLVPHPKPISSDGITFSYEGWRVGAYLIAGLGEPINGTPGNEIDLVAAYNRNIYLGNFLKEANLDIGIALFDFACPSLGNLKGDYMQPFVELRRPIVLSEKHSLVPDFRVEMPIPIGDGKAGAHIYLGIGHEWKLTSQLSFSHDVNVVGDTGAYGLDTGSLFLYRAGINWQVTDRLSISPSLKLTTPMTGARDRNTELSAGGSLNLNFRF